MTMYVWLSFSYLNQLPTSSIPDWCVVVHEFESCWEISSSLPCLSNWQKLYITLKLFLDNVLLLVPQDQHRIKAH